MEKNRNLIIGIICVMISETLFGMSFIFVKGATENVDAFTLLGWRFTVAIIIMGILILTGVIKVNFKGKDIKKLLAGNLIYPGLYFFGEAFGVAKTTASESGCIIASIPIFTLILSTIVLKKKPRPNQTFGIIFTVLGVVICTVVKGFDVNFSPTGYAFLFMSVLSYSYYAIYVERTPEFTGFERTFVGILVGFILFNAIAIIEHLYWGDFGDFISLPFKDMDFLTSMLFLSIGCSIIAFMTGNIALEKLGAIKSGSFIGWSTLVSIATGVLVRNESFVLMQGVGTVLIIGGVYIANREFKDRGKRNA